MLKYHIYKLLRFFHLISKDNYRIKTKKYTSEYRILAKSKYFDEKWYLQKNKDIKNSNIDAITHYLNIGWKKHQNPSAAFNGDEYLKQNSDVAQSGMNPLIHYETFGRKENRKLPLCNKPVTLRVYEKILFFTYNTLHKLLLLSNDKFNILVKKYIYADYRAIYKSRLFNKSYYIKQYKIAKEYDAIEHYLHTGYKLGYNPSQYFDNDFYLTNNTDILLADINPLYHYETSGKYENRKIQKVNIQKNLYSVEENDKNILLFSHELSLTGAPIALLNLADILKKNGYNPIFFSPSHGELENELRKHNISYIIEPYLFVKLFRNEQNLNKLLASFKLIFFNTIDTLKYATYINTDNYKICWVHEGEFGYKCANDAFDIRKAFKKIDKVYSVGNYSKSFTDEYIPENKSDVLLYGIKGITNHHNSTKKISTKDKIVFGIFGVCCERKGTDLFVNAIKKLPVKIKNNIIFKVIGRIDNDSFCDRIKNEAKGENIIFTGQLSHEETLAEMMNTDVIVCPSLDDPMPIVCTEAMMLKKVVICSNKTGTASFIKNGINGYIYNIEDNNLDKIIIDAYNNRKNFSVIGEKWNEVYINHFTENVFNNNVLAIISATNLYNANNIKNKSITDIYNILSDLLSEVRNLRKEN